MCVFVCVCYAIDEYVLNSIKYGFCISKKALISSPCVCVMPITCYICIYIYIYSIMKILSFISVLFFVVAVVVYLVSIFLWFLSVRELNLCCYSWFHTHNILFRFACTLLMLPKPILADIHLEMDIQRICSISLRMSYV